LAKEAGDAVPNGDNFDVEFTLVWENTGTVALDNVQLLDDIAAQFGSQFIGATLDSITAGAANAGSTPALNTAWETDTTKSLVTSTGPLEVGDTFEIVFTVTIDPDATGASSGGLVNQATSSGEALDENPTAENGEDNGDGTFGNDPTPIVIADISVAKEVLGIVAVGDNFEVTYQLVVENTGNVTLADVSLVDDLATQFGAAFVSAGSLTAAGGPSDPASSITLNTSAWDGDTVTELCRNDHCCSRS